MWGLGLKVLGLGSVACWFGVGFALCAPDLFDVPIAATGIPEFLHPETLNPKPSTLNPEP